MKNFDYSEDPGAVEGRQLASRRQLAELLLSQSIAGGPVYSNKAGIARALQGLIAGMDMGQAEKGERELAKRKDSERHDEMERIVAAAESPEGTPSRASLAKLLATSQNPGYSQAGLSMLMKGPGKLEWKETGDKLVGLDERGNVVREIPKGVSPDTKYTRETVSADTALTHGTPSAGAVLTDERTRSEGNANRGVTMRGQTMTDDRTRSEGAANRELTARGQDLTSARAGNKPMTEQQANASAFGLRAKAMHAGLEEMGTGGYVPSFKDVKTAGQENMNWMASEKGQKYLNAADNFTTAVLRKESGATITAEEKEQARRIYIPMPGDAPEVLKQKRANRELAIRALDVQATGTQGGQAGGEKQVVRTGTLNGRKVVQYADGTADYAP